MYPVSQLAPPKVLSIPYLRITMDSHPLTDDDRQLIHLELTNSTNARHRKRRQGFIIFLLGILIAITFYYSNGRVTPLLTLASLAALVFGLFTAVSWTLFSRQIAKLQSDFDNGRKHIGNHRISGYNSFTKKVFLDNGLKIDHFELSGEWAVGDHVYIELLPISGFVLKCDHKSAVHNEN